TQATPPPPPTLHAAVDSAHRRPAPLRPADSSSSFCPSAAVRPSPADASPPRPSTPPAGFRCGLLPLLGWRIGMVAAAATALNALVALGSASGTASKSSFVKSIVKAHDVVIFSKSYCPPPPPTPLIYPLCIPLYCLRLACWEFRFGM
ncbi:Os12g0266000, partial [Oryza sativa Japonica Group]